MHESVNRVQLRRDVAKESHFFVDWERPLDGQQNLMAGEVVQLLTSAGAALALINSDLKTAKDIIEKLKELYSWVRSLQKSGNFPKKDDVNPLTSRERLMIILFDELMAGRSSSTTQRLASLLGLGAEECHKQLLGLLEMGVIDRGDNPDKWSFKGS